MEMEAVVVQLMKIVVRGRIASSWQYRSYCTPCGQPASATGVVACPDELRSRQLSL